MTGAAARVQIDAKPVVLPPDSANDPAAWLRSTAGRSSAPGDQIGALRDLGLWRRSEPDLAVLLDSGQLPAVALRRFAIHLWANGEPARAVRPLLAAVALGSDDVDTLLELGSVLQAADRLEDALAAVRRAAQQAPSDARVWLKGALLLQTLERTDEALAHFELALHCDPDCSDASVGLGAICFARRRYAEAASHFSRAGETGCRDPMIGVAVGQARFLSGDFAGAAQALRAPVSMGAVNAQIRRRYALSRLIEHALAGDAAAGLAAWREAGDEPGDPGAAILQAFDILRGYGHRDAALQLAQLGACMSSGLIHPFLIDVLRDVRLERAPSDFLVDHFDAFAEHFDAQLVNVLDYHVPQKLARLIAGHVDRPVRIVDLGCGTGLSGAELRPLAAQLTGVDLSAKMLARAREKSVYDCLCEMDIDRFLDAVDAPFDCLSLADVLIYRGPLDDFFVRAARALAPGGLLAFSVETTADGPYRVQPSGRFAHDLSAVQAWAAASFEILDRQCTDLRLEANAPVAGALFLMRKI